VEAYAEAGSVAVGPRTPAEGRRRVSCATLVRVSQPSWNLRPARLDDQAFLLELHEKRMRDYVEQVWGWDDVEQTAIFEARFEPERWQIIQVAGEDIGLLIVENQADEIVSRRSRSSRSGKGEG
jgi:hypothetical protein